MPKLQKYAYTRKHQKFQKFPKPHTCEEGGAHLRSFFFCHLLMNFEKPEKSEF